MNGRGTVKRRGLKDTNENRKILRELGYSFTESEKRKRIFVKTSLADFAVIKEIIPDQ